MKNRDKRSIVMFMILSIIIIIGFYCYVEQLMNDRLLSSVNEDNTLNRLNR